MNISTMRHISREKFVKLLEGNYRMSVNDARAVANFANTLIKRDMAVSHDENEDIIGPREWIRSYTDMYRRIGYKTMRSPRGTKYTPAEIFRDFDKVEYIEIYLVNDNGESITAEEALAKYGVEYLVDVAYANAERYDGDNWTHNVEEVDDIFDGYPEELTSNDELRLVKDLAKRGYLHISAEI